MASQGICNFLNVTHFKLDVLLQRTNYCKIETIVMNKEFKIGLIVIIVFSILIIGVNYLNGLNLLNNHRSYYAVYDDIGGLQVGSSVMVNGYQIGMVGDIDLLVRLIISSLLLRDIE